MLNQCNCGIITVFLSDPHSQLINKILNNTEQPNGVGFYYQKNTVFLFNTYDNNPIPWLSFGCNTDLLMKLPFIDKIDFYPLNDQMEEKFRTLVLETINSNSKVMTDKNLVYTNLLLNKVNKENNNIMTGYNLVNKVLSNLTETNFNDSTKIYPCSLLNKTVSVILHNNSYTIDYENILESSRKEIIKLSAAFIDLFINNRTFRNNILSYNFELENLKDLQRLNNYIERIIQSLNDDIVNINIDELVNIYNNIVKNTKLNKINIKNNSNFTISRQAILTISNHEINIPNKVIPIPIYNADLKSLSDEQLMDILIYIDSLKDNNSNDTRFASLQNQITYELSCRFRTKQNKF